MRNDRRNQVDDQRKHKSEEHSPGRYDDDDWSCNRSGRLGRLGRLGRRHRRRRRRNRTRDQ